MMKGNIKRQLHKMLSHLISPFKAFQESYSLSSANYFHGEKDLFT